MCASTTSVRKSRYIAVLMILITILFVVVVGRAQELPLGTASDSHADTIIMVLLSVMSMLLLTVGWLVRRLVVQLQEDRKEEGRLLNNLAERLSNVEGSCRAYHEGNRS